MTGSMMINVTSISVLKFAWATCVSVRSEKNIFRVVDFLYDCMPICCALKIRVGFGGLLVIGV